MSEHTPGAGMERLKREFPGMVPELTEEDEARTDALLAAAKEALEKRYGQPRTAAQERAVLARRLGDDRIALDDMLMQFSKEDLDEAYARGVSEGLRRADNAINWQTSCLGCADRLDGLIAERARGYEEGLAEGRRQATEGWERSWGVDTPSGPIGCDDEEDARGYAALPGWGHVVSRLVGPWEPVEQPDPITPEVYAEYFPERDDAGEPLAVEQPDAFVVLVDQDGRCGCCRGTGEHPCGHECDSCDGSGKPPDSPVCVVPHGGDCTCIPEVGAHG